MWELTKSFRFEAAHALAGTSLGEASEEIHGHSFRAEIVIRGKPDPATGMLVDLTQLEGELDRPRRLLDHKLLNKIERLGAPTLENLSRFIWDGVQAFGGGGRVSATHLDAGPDVMHGQVQPRNWHQFEPSNVTQHGRSPRGEALRRRLIAEGDVPGVQMPAGPPPRPPPVLAHAIQLMRLG